MIRVSRMFLIVAVLLTVAGTRWGFAAEQRRSVSLDGTWQIAEGSMDQMPKRFEHKVPVPGLADMARPPFEAVGEKTSGEHRQAFWYRRSFQVDGAVPAVALLKIHKAKYGTRVLLNGKLVGDHVPCFTPGLFDVRGFLKPEGQANELVVRVGGSRDALPKSVPDGFDFEKVRYIPGIYDSVELILSGTPHIVRLQTVPDLEGRTVRVVAVLDSAGKETDAKLSCRVLEASSGKEIGSVQSDSIHLESDREQSVEVRVPIENCRLWSPEDPFLYELEASTGADTLRVRFGMRSFRFDPKTGRAMLNGKPYFLRGTNVCIFRFFGDPLRRDQPWREEWVRRLHRVFRSMHWNSIRYCIGFPPELWYRIADEEGLLIQDEFPIWYGTNKWPAELTSDELVKEYTQWMRERWNHPCVVIWDAQNESVTVTTETVKATAAVRHLDLSDRPWDNGYSPPDRPGDCFEAHPYVLNRPAFRMSAFADLPRVPGVEGGARGNVRLNAGNNPVIINEYAWLWLNRDGTPTTICKWVYERLLGPNSTTAQRRRLYARHLAAMTEFWRSHRQVAGVLNFCGLGYSRPGHPRPGAETSDHFLDIEKLNLEPEFETYVRDAFAPVGLMLDHWAEELPGGKAHRFRVAVINDLYTNWQGSVRLRILRGEQTVTEKSQPCKVKSLGREVLSFEVTVPAELGDYQAVAELLEPGKKPVRSWRDFAVLSARQHAAREDLAQGKPVVASSSRTMEAKYVTSGPPEAAVDGKPFTFWCSKSSDPQWLAVDLGEVVKISRVELAWWWRYGQAYAIQVSQDGETWKDVFKTDSGDGRFDAIRFEPTEARWVRLYGTKRHGGYALFAMRVFR